MVLWKLNLMVSCINQIQFSGIKLPDVMLMINDNYDFWFVLYEKAYFALCDAQQVHFLWFLVKRQT